MKSLLKVLLFASIGVLFTTSLSTKAKVDPPVQQVGAPANNAVVPEVGPYEQQWKTLFNDGRRQNNAKCVQSQFKIIDMLEEEKRSITGASAAVPRVKTNILEKRLMGSGPSSYFFDFLDSVLCSAFVDVFKAAWTEAKAAQPPANFKEPYSLEKIISQNPDATGGNEEQFLAKMKQLNPSFDEKTYKESITVGQFHTFIMNNKWYYQATSDDAIRKRLDLFDFNGDGRLNAREFIFAMYFNNVLARDSECKFCFKDVVKNYIDPIFAYLDCDDNGKLSAEEIWEGLQYLDRKDKTAYNMYLCQVAKQPLRTSSVNDFILKAKGTVDGYITKEEFRHGVFLGMWERRTSLNAILECTDESRSLKSSRWGDNGKKDISCDKIIASRMKKEAEIAKEQVAAAAQSNRTAK